MAEETRLPQTVNRSRKRKAGNLKKNKKHKQLPGPEEKVKKIDRKLRKLLRKKARDYNSDDEEEQEQEGENQQEGFGGLGKAGNFRREMEEEEEFGSEDEEGEEGEQGGIEPGITRFIEGCRAFRVAFLSIMKKTVVADDGPLGPVLSGHKKLVAEKLAEEEAEKKVKGEAKKEKHLVGEKGHVKPANYLDSHEKFLMGVATKGVVKLFNAVNKAQHAQKGLNPSRSKDAKVMKKRRKEAFFSELAKTPETETAKYHTSTGPGDSGGPSWAPLRDNYMLTNSKLKDWDKMPDTVVEDDIGKMSEDSGSDDD